MLKIRSVTRANVSRGYARNEAAMPESMSG